MNQRSILGQIIIGIGVTNKKYYRNIPIILTWIFFHYLKNISKEEATKLYNWLDVEYKGKGRGEKASDLQS